VRRKLQLRRKLRTLRYEQILLRGRNKSRFAAFLNCLLSPGPAARRKKSGRDQDQKGPHRRRRCGPFDLSGAIHGVSLRTPYASAHEFDGLGLTVWSCQKNADRQRARSAIPKLRAGLAINLRDQGAERPMPNAGSPSSTARWS